jgi:hypothetical protein
MVLFAFLHPNLYRLYTFDTYLPMEVHKCSFTEIFVDEPKDDLHHAYSHVWISQTTLALLPEVFLSCCSGLYAIKSQTLNMPIMPIMRLHLTVVWNEDVYNPSTYTDGVSPLCLLCRRSRPTSSLVSRNFHIAKDSFIPHTQTECWLVCWHSLGDQMQFGELLTACLQVPSLPAVYDSYCFPYNLLRCSYRHLF